MTTLKCLAVLLVLSVSLAVNVSCAENGFYHYGPFARDSALPSGANPATAIVTEEPYFFYGKPYNGIWVN